jgi:Glycosyltransferase family 87
MPLEEGIRSRTLKSGPVARRALDWLVFGVVPIAIFCFLLAVAALDSEGWAFDFRQFWQGGNDVVNGVSPYPSPGALETADDDLDPEGIQEVFRFPYPAAAAFAYAPLGALEFDTAAAVWAGLLIVCVLAAVWILGVRDWRVVGVVISSAPVIGAVAIGTLTPVLLLLVAIAWRWRSTFWVAGGAVAVAVSLKLFLWPLALWLAATRRWWAALAATGLAITMTFAAWAAIGWAGFSDYPDLVRRLADVVQDRGYSLVALGVEAGLPEGIAETLPWAVGLPLLAMAVMIARRDADDRTALSLTMVAAIALTPIVWLHYFVLLVVPLALARPRLSLAWGLMWVFWLTPAQENGGDLWPIVLVLALMAAALVVGKVSPRSSEVR